MGWDLAHYRSYDPTIGRWLQIDPKASERESPYVGFANMPNFYIDPLGDTIRYGTIQIDNFWTDTHAGRDISAVGESISDGISSVREAVGSGLESVFEYIGISTDEGTGQVHTTKSNSGDDSDVRSGQIEGVENVDAIIGASIRSSPASSFVEGFAQGVQMVTTVESYTGIIEDAVTPAKPDSIPVITTEETSYSNFQRTDGTYESHSPGDTLKWIKND